MAASRRASTAPPLESCSGAFETPAPREAATVPRSWTTGTRRPIRLCGPAEPRQADSCQKYALYPTDELQSWFQGFDLSSRDRQRVLGQSSWLVRTFGDVRLETLLVPSDLPDGSVLNAMERRRIRGQAGSVIGLTARRPVAGADRRPAPFLERRPAPCTGHRRRSGRPVLRRSPPPGRGHGLGLVHRRRHHQRRHRRRLVLGSSRAGHRGGTDLRLGRFTVRPIWRVRSRTFNARVTTTF